MSGATAASSLLDCARTQVRVVGALMLRDMQTLQERIKFLQEEVAAAAA